jgi:hypothetical protein
MWKQIVGSALLLLCACAIVDRLNCKVPLSVFALYMGFLIMGLGISFSMNCGVPVNPARDLSPRLFTYLVGWGPQVFRYARVSYCKNMLHISWNLNFDDPATTIGCGSGSLLWFRTSVQPLEPSFTSFLSKLTGRNECTDITIEFLC